MSYICTLKEHNVFPGKCDKEHLTVRQTLLNLLNFKDKRKNASGIPREKEKANDFQGADISRPGAHTIYTIPRWLGAVVGAQAQGPACNELKSWHGPLCCVHACTQVPSTGVRGEVREMGPSLRGV